MTSNMTVKELRNQLRQLGLDSTGKKADLVHRLTQAQVHGKSNNEREHCAAIVACTIDIDDDSAMISHAKEELSATIEHDHLFLEIFRDDIVVRNMTGLEYAQSMTQGQVLESRLAALEKAHADLETSHANLCKEVGDLRDSLVDFSRFRHRFLSTYKRDILHNATENDHQLIALGNGIAHGGNCKRDSELYRQPGGRGDKEVYKDLYGLLPNVLQALITYAPTISVLDKHATLKAENLMPEDCEVRFLNFISALKEFDYPDDYLENSTSKVAAAYWEFMGSASQQTRKGVFEDVAGSVA